ncbi:tRNA (guanine-N1)-methyltransferase [Mangrovimonas aestuarii]|uniref:tRNA (guanine-N1)-methyltransferase n=1 Tax=Mangrovimonas aestuarii TaxID=3018443 RepID=UPI002378D33B|nr:tRNA (guanine-N1)-methyltransferase [Mangrovimonas aestuarii]
MNHFKLITLLLIACFSLNLQAQTNDSEDDGLSLNSGTISNQFDYVIQKSNNYQDYKVVKRHWLSTLKSHTMDSLKAVRKNLADTQAIVDTQAKEITELKGNLENTQNNLEQTNLEKDSIQMFGFIPMSKGSYSMTMWSIIGGLLVFLLFFIYRFKNSNTVTKQAQKALRETEEEFEEHRKVALEREQKVRRQLQDELNKQKALV